VCKIPRAELSQTEIRVGGGYLPTPAQRGETEPCIEETDQANEDKNVTENNDNVPEGNTRPTRIRNKPKHLEGYVLYNDEKDNINYTVDYCYRGANIPTTYKEAVDSLEVSKS